MLWSSLQPCTQSRLLLHRCHRITNQAALACCILRPSHCQHQHLSLPQGRPARLEPHLVARLSTTSSSCIRPALLERLPDARLSTSLLSRRAMDVMYEDRTDAAERLAEQPQIKRYKDDPNVVVIGLPRGGVPMAEIIAQALNAPMDLIVPRKIGHPAHPEFALGALTEFGEVYWNDDFLSKPHAYGLTPHHPSVQRVVDDETREAARRKRAYRPGMPDLHLKGRTAIVVDDGIATGATMKAAIASLRRLGVARVVVAVPVGSPGTLRDVARLADDVVCPAQPTHFQAVGQFYEHFGQTEDEEVLEVMRRQAGQQQQRLEQQRKQQQTRQPGKSTEAIGGAAADDKAERVETDAADASKDRVKYRSGKQV